jgi:peptidoglycan/LPS O-acetylase OafA/YrhL
VKGSFGDILDRNQGVGPGFDFLRLGLAISIVIYHSADVTQGENFDTGFAWLYVESTLPMFFALSGFLVTASAQRLSLDNFILNRGLRIFPALLVEIVFSAAILGAVCTTLPVSDYYNSRDFLEYFLNVTGFIRYQLPGVFLDNPHKGMVNASLWTIPWELLCYFILAVLILTGLIRRRRFILLVSLFAMLLPAVLYLVALVLAQVPALAQFARPALDPRIYFNPPALDLDGVSAGGFAKWLLLTLVGWEYRVIPFFLSGCLLYTFRYRVPCRWGIGAILVALMLLASFTMPVEWDGPLLNLALCPALSYLTVLIGLTRMPVLPIYRHGDYSYGIYLYGYPIQQAVLLAGLDRHVWWQNAIVSVPLTLSSPSFPGTSFLTRRHVHSPQ